VSWFQSIFFFFDFYKPGNPGTIIGTAAYMSPEQAKGKPIDRRTGILAFGCVLDEMLSGQQAFGGETATDTMAAVTRAEPDWKKLPASIPAEISNAAFARILFAGAVLLAAIASGIAVWNYASPERPLVKFNLAIPHQDWTFACTPSRQMGTRSCSVRITSSGYAN
jgi:serine/threonine protein kinase